MNKSKLTKLITVIGASLITMLLPTEAFGIEGLTVIEQRVIGLFIFAALMWILEVIPIWTTSVSVIVLMIMLASNSMLAPLNTADAVGEAFGTPISYKAVMATFADPIIMLFMGGFALAIGATKVGLDINLARVMLKPFGTRSEVVLLGFMIVTAIFSMFMSNTATAAMMLAIVAPVLRQMPEEGKGRTALALCIPVAANVGGIGTPIGTPPNAIALRYISESGLDVHIGFGQWMLVMVPFVLVMMALAWVLLIKLYPFSQRNFVFQLNGSFRTDWRSIVVYVTFGVTIILWLLDKRTGMNSNSIAMIPLAIFCVTGIIGKEELKSINWDVLWLVAGGFALGVGLEKSGLAAHIISSIPFGSWSPFFVLAGSGLICYLMSTFMSHSASSALLVPILATVAVGMGDTLTEFGGITTMLVGVAVSSSLAMALPISTPPNALAHATGMVEQRDMIKTGVIIGIVGIILGYIFIYGGCKMGILG